MTKEVYEDAHKWEETLREGKEGHNNRYVQQKKPPSAITQSKGNVET